MLSGYPACIYLGLLAVAVMQYLLHRTAWGLRIRAVGENPAAVATLGINVHRLRMRAVLLGGVFAGMGGAVMCLSSANVFVNDMSAGSGFMAFAANQFGQWSPRRRLSCHAAVWRDAGAADAPAELRHRHAADPDAALSGRADRHQAHRYADAGAGGQWHPYPHPLSAPCLRRKSAGESQSKGSKA